MDRRRGANNLSDSMTQRGGVMDFRSSNDVGATGNGDSYGAGSPNPNSTSRRDIFNSSRGNGNTFWKPRSSNDQRTSSEIFPNSNTNHPHKFQHHHKQTHTNSANNNNTSGSNKSHFSNHKSASHQGRHTHSFRSNSHSNTNKSSSSSSFRFRKGVNGNGSDAPKRTSSNGSRFKNNSSFSNRPFSKGHNSRDTFRHQHQIKPPAEQPQLFPIYDDTVPDDEYLMADNQIQDTQPVPNLNQQPISNQQPLEHKSPEPSQYNLDVDKCSDSAAERDPSANGDDLAFLNKDEFKSLNLASSTHSDCETSDSPQDSQNQIHSHVSLPESLESPSKNDPNPKGQIKSCPSDLPTPIYMPSDRVKYIALAEPFGMHNENTTKPISSGAPSNILFSPQHTEVNQSSATANPERVVTAEEIDELMKDNYSNDPTDDEYVNDDEQDFDMEDANNTTSNYEKQSSVQADPSSPVDHQEPYIKLDSEEKDKSLELPNSSRVHSVQLETPLEPPVLDSDEHHNAVSQADNLDLPPLGPPQTPSPEPEDPVEAEIYLSSPITKIPKKRSKKSKKSKDEIHYQIFNDLPSKTEEAQQTFETMVECTYTSKSMGSSGQYEAMTCDCRESWGEFISLFDFSYKF